MKRKRFNYYNLFVYGFKFFAIFGLICGFLFVLSGMYSADFWDWIFISLAFTSYLLMILFINLTKKYENKITTYIEKPKKPREYILSDIKISDIEQKLIEMNYERISNILENTNIYYNEKRSIWLNPDHKPQKNIIVFFTAPEFTKEITKYLLQQKQKITRTLKEKRGSFQTIFFVTVDKENEYLQNYLKNRTSQYYRNYYLLAIYTKKDSRLYIPHCDSSNWPYYQMRKRLLKILSNYLAKKYK